MPETIKYFMWGFQPLFRSSVEHSLNRAMEAINVPVEGRGLLVGFLREGEAGWPICVEPEDWIVHPDALQGVLSRAEQLLEEHPDRSLRHSGPGQDEAFGRRLLDRVRADALTEALSEHLAGSTAIVGPSAPVGKYNVHTVVVLPGQLSQLAPEISPIHRPGHPPTPTSLVRALLDQILYRSARGLFLPDPGASLDALGASTEEIIREAAQSFMDAIAEHAGQLLAAGLYDAMNKVSLQRLESEVGTGSLLLANPTTGDIRTCLDLANPVSLREPRLLRKLLQIAQGANLELITDGRSVLALGAVSDDYDTRAERVFSIAIRGEGVWRIASGSDVLLEVAYGSPRIPIPRLGGEQFIDTASRLFEGSPELNAEALWGLVTTAMTAPHGTLLIISSDAEAEAGRLGEQAIRLTPGIPTEQELRGLTDIDGAVLLSPDATCHAVGVILDGVAGPGGDPSRGARFNSAVRYVQASTHPTLAVVVSEDGMVNLVPHLRPRIRREEITATLAALLDTARQEPIDFEFFYRARTRLESLEFYLSPDDCASANEATAFVEDVRWNHYGMRISQQELRPDLEMSDDYFLD